MLPPLLDVMRRGKQALRRHYGRLKGQMMRVTEPNWGPVYTGGVLMNVRRWSAPTGRNWTFGTLRLPTDAGWGTSAMRKVNVVTDRPCGGAPPSMARRSTPVGTRNGLQRFHTAKPTRWRDGPQLTLRDSQSIGSCWQVCETTRLPTPA